MPARKRPGRTTLVVMEHTADNEHDSAAASPPVMGETQPAAEPERAQAQDAPVQRPDDHGRVRPPEVPDGASTHAATQPLFVERERPSRRPLVSRTLIAVVLGAAAIIALALALATWYLSGIGMLVPNVIGIQEGVARARLAQAGLEVSSVERRFDVQPEGTVLAQSPGEGARLPRGGGVALVVSAGTEEFIMPDVTGTGINVARAQLEQRGLVVRIEAVESDQPSDTVLETIPSPGSLVRTSDIVRVRIASEGTASEALLPFPLQGTSFVIDPSPIIGADVDPPLEVARRLRSLLEASGAQVIITRSITETDAPAAARAQRASEAPVTLTALVGLDIVADAPVGLGVLVPGADTVPEQQAQASSQLADVLGRLLTEQQSGVTRSVLGSDPVVAATSAPSLRIRLGALASREDVAAFRDPTWSDTVARAIYRALGEQYAK